MLLNPEVLAASASPFADASEIFLGPVGKYVIALGAVISTCGALNGWTLLQGHIPMAAAQDGLFPKLFQDKNTAGSPVKGIVVTSSIVSVLLVFNYVKELVSLFTMMISLSTLAVLVPYFFSVAAYALLNYRKSNFMAMLWSVLAGLFLLWVCVGCGWEVILYGTSFIILGIFFKFVWTTRDVYE
jgi:APA family basic amino acid/polyamine antiporter